MSVLPRSGSVVVSRLRVVSARDDPLAVRLRASTLLGAARLEPSGFPPSAIVVVRKLVDPLPGSLPLRGLTGRPRPEWEQAVAAELDRLIRRAARPALGAVPADAEAVVFADTSEWLACLAADWVAGLVAAHWWWHSLLRQVDAARLLSSSWLAAPESVPAALQHLARRGQIAAFARALTEGDARALLDAVVLRFGLSSVREALDRVEETPSDTSYPGSKTSPEGSPARPEQSPLTTERPGAAPWLARAPESGSAGLSPPARALLGVGLTLARAPAEARTPGFALRLGRWLATISRSETGRAPLLDHGFAAEARPASPPPIGPNVIASDRPSESHPADAESRPASAKPSREPGPDLPVAPTFSPPFDSEPVLLSRAAKVKSSPTGPHVVPPVEPDGGPVSSEDAGPLVVPVITDFGGLFYLINLGLFLGLYGDFATPAEPGIALDIWDFVALVGLRLVGDPVRDDPVWALLARLAGRDKQEPPGRDFEPEDDWRLPPEWLSAFPDPGGWDWDVGGDRLRVRHSEGFLVLNVPRGASPIEGRLSEELRGYPAVPLRHGPVPGAKVDGLPVERWLDRLLPYLRARLCRALGVREPAALGQTLCTARARILVTADRLDVMLSLDKHPVAIRLAGLDRDPGWIPAAGRFVAFHFE